MVVLLIITSHCIFGQNNITEHIVKSGESLSKISTIYDVSVDDIKEFNGLITNMIFIDQIINIPGKDTTNYNLNLQMNQLQNMGIFTRICIKDAYYSQIDIRELTGNNDGIQVEKYLSSANLGKGYPWCASFINWSFMECGINLNLKYPAWVPSYFPSDKLIMVRGQFQLRKPIFGDLIGIWFESKDRLAHIGFYDGENSKYYFTVEGNTNKAGSREGDGVYRKRRIKRQVHSISSWVEN